MKVFIIAALTVDGFIGKNADHLADWTSREDKKLFVQLTKEAGTMVMGARTFDTIGRALPGRTTIVYTTHPEKYQDIEGVEATSEPPQELVKRLGKKGVKALAICGGASVYQLFLQAGVVDELYLTIEPVSFGSGVRLFSGETEKKLSLVEVKKLNENTILTHYKVL